jgi:CO/xanthine dehydrogenase Mo-binding subunit
VVACAAPAVSVGSAAARSAATPFPLAVHPNLDNWIAVHQDGTVTVSIAKADIGTHMQSGMLQIAAEELEMPYERMRIRTGDTMFTPDLGVSSGSAGITGGGPPVRAAAATARQALVGMAAARFGVPAGQLMVQDGVVSVIGNSSQRVSYAELIGGRLFNVTMTQNTPPYPYTPAYGNALPYGTAPLKDPATYKLVGTNVPAHFVREKVTGTHVGVTQVRIPGMVHARVVRPPMIGARLLGIDRSSVRHVEGLLDVIVKKDFIAVVAKQEWAAIQAAAQLKVSWSDWAGGAKRGLPNTKNLYEFMRAAPSIRSVPRNVGNLAAAFAGAAKIVSGTYRSAHNTHGPIGPPAAVADVRSDQAIVWSSSQSIFGMRAVVAKLLNLPESSVRFIFYSHASAYGSSNADDCAIDACMISQAIGRPVRVQYMRHDDLIWGGGRAARVTDVRAGLDASGNVVAWDGETWTAANGGRPYGDLYATHGVVHEPERIVPSKTLPGVLSVGEVLAGIAPAYDVEGGGSGNAPSRYTYSAGTATHRWTLNHLGTGSPRADPLDGQPQAAPAGSVRIRTSSQAGVGGTPAMFVFESFMDELAAAAGVDPIDYRLRYLVQPRDVAVLKALAERAGWQPRTSPGPQASSNDVVVRGRGVAIGKIAQIFEVEVNRKTGKVTVKRVVSAIDVGRVINPDSVTQQIEGNTMFGISQALKEERRSDGKTITSRDWVTYPILRFVDIPTEFDVVLVNPKPPDLPPRSAGEVNGSAAPAIGNAIFDATGVRLRTMPFTPQRVLDALKEAGKASK